MELVNIIWLREVSVNGMVKLGMNECGELWKKYMCKRMQVGKEPWEYGFNDTEREEK